MRMRKPLLDENFLRILRKKFSSPLSVQDYLDSITFNFAENGETCLSPVRVLSEKKADCLEGAFLAAAVMWAHGEIPYIMNLKVHAGLGDDDHAVALFRRNGYWGAVSKTNHAMLRFRDPVYKTYRELAMSYFHEYYLEKNGVKIMKGFSRPIDMRKFGSTWLRAQEDLWDIAEAIFDTAYIPTVVPKNKRFIRKATAFERKVTSIPEHKQKRRRRT